MAAQTKSKSFNYLVAQWFRRSNLQRRLDATLKDLKGIGERRQRLDKDGLNQRFVVKPRTTNGMLCGMMICYTKGNGQPTLADVDDDTGVEDLDIEQLAPEEVEPGKRREFLEGVLYFGIRNNHVILVQSSILKAKQFTEHLNWLFSQKSKEGKEVNPVGLIPRPEATMRDQAVQGVKSIVFKDPLTFEPAHLPATAEPTVSQELVLRKSDGGKGNHLFQAFLEAFGKKTMDFGDALETGDIELRLEILYKKPGQRKDRQMLDNVVAALGDHLDESITLEIPGVGERRGDHVRIHEDYTVAAPGGFADPPEVFKKMFEWLQLLLEHGTIRGEE